MELNDSDSALQWASMVASSDRVIRSLQGLQSPTDIVRGVIEEEIKETLHNFTDSGNASSHHEGGRPQLLSCTHLL